MITLKWILKKHVFIFLLTLLLKHRSKSAVFENVNEFNVYWTVHHCNSWRMKDQLDVTCYFYFTFYVPNMFRTLIFPLSGAFDCVVELPHRSSCSQFVVYWRFGVAGFEWCSFCRLKHNCWFWVVLVLQAEAQLLQPWKQAPLKTSHTKSPTHNELRTRRPMW